MEHSLLLRAAAGSGKTSLARSLARAALESGVTCVYFPCFLLQEDKALRETIVEFLQTLARESRENAAAYLDSVKLLILDGCDEAAMPEGALSEAVEHLFTELCQRRSVAQQLGEGVVSFVIPDGMPVSLLKSDEAPGALARPTWPLRRSDFQRLRLMNPLLADEMESFEQTYLDHAPRLVLTIRDESPFHGSDTLACINLSPFTDSQLMLFLSKWLGNHTSADEVWQFLQANPHVLEVCRRPIVATLLVAMHENGMSLPNSRSELYTQRFALLLGEWDEAKGLERRSTIPVNEKLLLLSKLAFELHRRKSRQFTRRDFIRLWLDRFAQVYPTVNPDHLLWELQAQNGVLQSEGPTHYSLGHLSFQEYLAARGAVFFQQERYLLEQFENPWWRSVLVFYAGLRGDISPFIERLHQGLRLLSAETQLLAGEMVQEARFTSGVVRAFFKDSGLLD